MNQKYKSFTLLKLMKQLIRAIISYKRRGFFLFACTRPGFTNYYVDSGWLVYPTALGKRIK